MRRRQWDAYTIKSAVPSLELMERAASAVAAYVVRHFAWRTRRVVAVCGPGNNGGDGWAALRFLQPFYEVYGLMLNSDPEKFSPDCRHYYELFRKKGGQAEPWSEEAFKRLLGENVVILDAILGSGLNRAPEGSAARAIRAMNASGCPVVAVDIPSGLAGDNNDHLAWSDRVVKSYCTITFQAPYRSFFYPENTEFVAQFEVAPIGLLDEFQLYEPGEVRCFYSTLPAIRGLVKPRPRHGHKGTFGRVLVVGGSTGMCGAALLAARAAKAAGAGLVYLAAPESCRTPAQTALPEIIFVDYDALLNRRDKGLMSSLRPDVVAMGPGWGLEGGSSLIQLLAECFPQALFVLDADALNRMAGEVSAILGHLRERALLTPHPGEMDRLVPSPHPKDTPQRLATALSLCEGNQATIVLKGRYTAIVSTGMIWFNTTGNHWLATGGSGDLLTGLAAGILAQGYGLNEGARLAVWLHGRSADIAAQSTYKPFDLEDLLSYLPQAMAEIDFAGQT
ncbi:MAG: NAD(P)H-hydrate dehydratase [Flavobacteriales bacterium]|nr:NAD(P)H-hydrate dehydratase [Flavobacteriales bacterium]